jgi:hypothetical protein
MKAIHLITWLGCAGIVGGALSQGAWLTAGLAAVTAVYANLAYRRECGDRD